VIGGTGLETLPSFRKAAVLNITTPWGDPSSPITILEHPSPSTGKPIPIAFLARHGLHHALAPHEVPSRANIAALRHIGVRCVIAFSAAGSLAEEVKPRDFVVPDQVIDRTKGVRPWTFFEDGVVCHVPFADPFDKKVGEVVRRCGHSLEGEGVVLHDRGCVIVMGKLVLVLFAALFILIYSHTSFALQRFRVHRIKGRFALSRSLTRR
jgi:5'-methylthioadenosine phosphorylase